MSQPSAREVVDRYFELFSQKRYEESRPLLADQGFSFQGPIDRFDDADTFIEVVKNLGMLTREIRKLKVFEDGPDVCVIYDFVMQPPGEGTIPIAEWFHVEDGKIRSIRIMFDARPFAPFFAKQ